MSKNKVFSRAKGFTLLEILVALFVFSILSLLLATSLRSVINAQEGTERSADNIRQLQWALLILSRDIEQAVDRPIVNAVDAQEPALVGTAKQLHLTHMGYANPFSTVLRSNLQRSGYSFSDHVLWRQTWDALDQASNAKPHTRELLQGVQSLTFQYVDKEGGLHASWPLEGETLQPLPRAIKINLTLTTAGKISQLYIISGEQIGSHETP